MMGHSRTIPRWSPLAARAILRTPARLAARPGVERLEDRILPATDLAGIVMTPPIEILGPIAPPGPPPPGGTGTGVAAPGDPVQGTAHDQVAQAATSTGFVALATFTVPDSVFNGSWFSATIDWGDGSPTTPGVSGFGVDQGGLRTVTFSGQHTYARPGSYTFQVSYVSNGVSLAMATGTASVSAFNLQEDGVNGAGIDVGSEPGAPVVDAPLASFSGPGALLGNGQRTATIDWGDGTTTAGIVGVIPDQNGSPWFPGNAVIPVFGSHTYASAGQYPIAVTLSVDGYDVGTATSTATVAPGATNHPIQATGLPQAAIAGVPISFPDLAALTAPAGVTDRSGLGATVDWGDGTPVSPAQPSWDLSALGGQAPISIAGRHDYADPGTYTYAVTFTIDGVARATATGTVTVSAATGPIVTETATDQTTIAGLPTDFSLARFSIPEAVFDGSAFTASIDWGDGTAAGVGAPDLGGTTEGFSGVHAYAQPGTYTFTVTYISDGIALGSASGTVTVTPGDPGGLLRGRGIDQAATAGVPTSFLPLATFSAPSSAMIAFSSSSTVDWGDGTTSYGMPTMNLTTAEGRTTDRVAGRHAYEAPGTYTYTVTYILDDSITASASGTITVGAATAPAIVGRGIDQSATAGAPGNFFPLASFTMPMSTFVDSSSTVHVDWGDGTPASSGMTGFTWEYRGDQVIVSVGSDHTYADPGSYSYVVTYTLDGATATTATGTITVVAAGSGQGSLGDTGAAGPTQSIPSGSVAETTSDLVPPGNMGPQAYHPAAAPMAPPTPAAPTSLVAEIVPARVVATSTAIPAFAAVDDIALEGLWAGLYTGPFSSPAGLSAPPTSQATGTATATDPLHPNLLYWDAGLDLLAT